MASPPPPSKRPGSRVLPAIASLAFSLGPVLMVASAAAPSPDEYLEFIRTRAASLRSGDRPPATLEDWRGRRDVLRRRLLTALGEFPAEPCPLEPKAFGTLRRAGYRVEKVAFQTRPGVWMTANAYVPDGPGTHPAILCVHGHWRGAKQDPVVQARCIGAAKLGFFVLVVDAFGAGERGVGKALGEYHGALTAATLLPVGLTLAGLQVYENIRAVDYLRTRPEVDAARIGVTGASGGGNQTMYAAACDDRLEAAVPVCSVGNYQAYLGTGCCLCELVPGALGFTEEWGVLGLVAPRALMVVNATRDAPQFSVGEAKKSLALVEPLFGLYGRPGLLRHALFESGHDYSRAMREAMYGWMALQLKAEGDGSPILEPEVETEDPETLRCYPGDSRPEDWLTIPRFAARRAREVLSARSVPKDAEGWRTSSEDLKGALLSKVLGGFPDPVPDPPRVESSGEGQAQVLRFRPEAGLELSARVEGGKRSGVPLAILIDLEGAQKAASGAWAEEVRRVGWKLVTLDLRATGALSSASDRIGQVPDHNSAEWGLWIGRPLIGQWVVDVRRLLDALERADGSLPPQVVLIGTGPGGLVALASAAVDGRVTTVVAAGNLASYVTGSPYVGQRLGVMAPGILREVGDVADLAALIAPRRLVVAGGVAGDGKPLDLAKLREAYRPASQVWDMLGVGRGLTLLEASDPVEALRASH